MPNIEGLVGDGPEFLSNSALSGIFLDHDSIGPEPESMVLYSGMPLANLPLGDYWQRVSHLWRTERRISPRPAGPADIPAMVDIDFRAYQSVYRHSEQSEEVIKAEQLEIFTQRFKTLGSEWIEVIEVDGQISGYIMGCPTSKPPEDFVSWEDTTDNGRLTTAFDPQGDYLYLVCLATLARASDLGGHNMLMGRMIAKIVAQDKIAYFESRMPGFYRWASHRCREQQRDVGSLTKEETDVLAQRYVDYRVTVGEIEVRADPLLRAYDDIGCDMVKVVPDAYQDPLSMNYGAIFKYESPLPSRLRQTPALRQLAGTAIGLISRSPYLTEKLL